MKKSSPLSIIPSREGEISIWCQGQMLDPKGLIPHPDNNNTHSEQQLEMAKAVLRANGWRNPVVISKKNDRIISGHLRVLAAIQMGMEKVPVDIQYFENRVEEVKHLTADNELARPSEFNKVKFIDYQKEQEAEMDKDTYQLTFYNPHEHGLAAYPKEKPEGTKKEPVIVIKEGDVWNLGPHRLELGDFSTPNTADKIQKLLKSWRKLHGAPALLETEGDSKTYEEVFKERTQEEA